MRLPLTSAHTIDPVVSEMSVIGFPGGRATLIETVSVEQTVAATEATLML